MNYRHMIAAASLTLLAATAATAQEQWKMLSNKGGTDIGAVNDDQVLAAFNKAAGGKVVAERHYTGNEQEATQFTQRGRVPMAVASAFGVGVVVPDVTVLSLPFLWNSEAERVQVTQKIMPQLREMFREKGLELLFVGDVGYNGVFCKSRCTVPSDLAKQKVRVSPAAVSKKFWDAVGAIPVQLPVGDTWPALDQNLVVGGDLPFTYYVSTPGVRSAPVFVKTNHTHHPWLYFAHKATWNKLPEETRKAVLASYPDQGELTKRRLDDDAKKEKALAEQGMKIVAPTEAQLNEWRAKLAPMVGELVKEMSPNAQKLYAEIRKEQAEYRKAR